MQPSRTSEEAVAHVLDAFKARFGDVRGVQVAQAPGRVNLIGEHTDYNDGFALPMTLDRATYVGLRPRPDSDVRLYALNFDEAFIFSLEDALPDQMPGWAKYVAGAVIEAQGARTERQGVEGVVWGNVPLGAGLSSSAALEVATVMAVDAVLGTDRSGEDAAALSQQVEHTYAGVACGIMDQFASRLGSQGHALFLDCRSLTYRPVPLSLSDVRVVVVDSGVQRELATSAYNERRAECEAAVAFFQQIDPAPAEQGQAIRALRDVSPALFEAHQHALPETLRKRSQHVIQENQRVREAAEALEQRDISAFGQLMNASHASLRDLYEVSGPELDVLAETAQALPGVWGARMTGGGFGGCTVNLVEPEAVSRFCDELQAQYEARCGRRATLYVLEHNLEATVFAS
ncbi:MAG: galactokinase [Rhodothermales bacterium]